MSKTIAEIAVEYAVDTDALVRSYARHDKRCKSGAFIPPRQKLLRKCLLDLGSAPDEPEDALLPVSDDDCWKRGADIDFVKDRTSTRLNLPPRSRFTIHLHQQLLESLDSGELKGSGLERRVSLVVQHLASHGRTSIVKGCVNGNEGWRRTPLGGRGGMHYYIWWSPAGAPPVKDLETDGQSIYIRDIRHHDDHTVLLSGSADDYLLLSPAAMQDVLPSPLTEDQLNFCRSEAPVRILAGNPGVGKTTALWGSLLGRDGEKVLYLTWSKALCRQAREYFDSFGPAGSHITVNTIAEYVAGFTAKEVSRAEIERGYDLFRGAVSKLPPAVLGHWGKRKRLLYEEIRAHYFGSLPHFCRPASGTGALVADLTQPRALAYIKEREKALGSANAYTINRLVKAIEIEVDDPIVCFGVTIPQSPLGSYFPDLEQARLSYGYLFGLLGDSTDGEVNYRHVSYDRIVIDELQDLTPLEYGLVLYAARWGAFGKNNTPPFIVAAGDEGQTVVATDFRWAEFKGACRRILITPEEHLASTGLRSPKNLDLLAEFATDLYGVIEKERRPRALSRKSDSEATCGRLFALESNGDEALELLTFLSERPATIIASAENSKNLPKALRHLIKTPEQIKGLEAQTVVVINPASTLGRLTARPYNDGTVFNNMFKRRLLDGFRVALSRSTETLVLLDIDPDAATAAITDLLALQVGEHAVVRGVGVADFMTLLKNEDGEAGVADMIQACLSDVEQYLDSDPSLALFRVGQASSLLGEAGVPGSVADLTLRREVLEASIAAQLAGQAAIGLPFIERITLFEYIQPYRACAKAAAALGNPAAAALFGLFGAMSDHVGSAESQVEILAEIIRTYPDPDEIPLPDSCRPYMKHVWEDIYSFALSSYVRTTGFDDIALYTINASLYGICAGHLNALNDLLAESLANAVSRSNRSWAKDIVAIISSRGDGYYGDSPPEQRKIMEANLKTARRWLAGEPSATFVDFLKNDSTSQQIATAMSEGRHGDAVRIAGSDKTLQALAAPAALIESLKQAEQLAADCRGLSTVQAHAAMALLASISARISAGGGGV